MSNTAKEENEIISKISQTVEYSPPCRKGTFCTILKHPQTSAPIFLTFGGQVSSTSMRNDTWIHFLPSNLNHLQNNHLENDDLKWRNLFRNITAPEKRWKGSLTAVENRTKGILFGGSDFVVLGNGSLFELFYNDVWSVSFDGVEDGGRNRDEGKMPAVYKRLMPNDNIVNLDVHGSDDGKKKVVANRPAARRAHTAVLFGTNGNEVIIFGGKSQAGDVLNDVWLYDVSKNSFLRITAENDDETNIPRPRKGHAAISFSNESSDFMLVHGGRVDDNTYLDDAFMLSREKGAKPAIKGSFKWEKILYKDNGGPKPMPRNHHSAVYNKKLHSMIIFGGRSSYSSYKTHTQVWSLNLTDFSWTTLPITFNKNLKDSDRDNEEALSRMEHCVDQFNGSMVMFGGQSQFGTRLNDLWTLEVVQDSKTPRHEFQVKWSELETDHCGLLSEGEIANLETSAFIIGAFVLVIGMVLMWWRFNNGNRAGYRRL